MSSLILVDDGKPYVLSVTVAKEFGRPHKNVLQSLDSLLQDGTVNGLDLKPVNYRDSHNQDRRAYEMSERGFLIAMPFIGGKKSRLGQTRLVDAFLKFRTAVERRASLDWQQARLEGKDARKHEVDTIAAFVEYATAQGSSNARHYYANVTKMTYKALFMVEQGLKIPNRLREMLDGMQLSFLTTAEYVCANAIKDGMARELHYKDIYTMAKTRVEQYAASVGRTLALPH